MILLTEFGAKTNVTGILLLLSVFKFLFIIFFILFFIFIFFIFHIIVSPCFTYSVV